MSEQKLRKKKSSKAKLREFFIANVGVVLDSKTLREVADASEWARRVRELKEEGMNIVTGNDRSDLKKDQYILVDLTVKPSFERK